MYTLDSPPRGLGKLLHRKFDSILNRVQQKSLFYISLPTPSLLPPYSPLSLSEGGEVCIIERLFSSSLVAMVELAHPRKLRACHFKVSVCVFWE